jgi:hypothetical protein
VLNVIRLDARSQRPDGVVIMCDVAREDASVVIRDLKRLGIHHEGSIALELIDTAISDRAQRAEEHARGAPADAVVWEEVEAKTDEQVELSGVFLAFMVLAALIATVGIYQDSPILIVAACAGAAGMLSLSTAKSGALIGVLISVTTIPAAANIGVTAAYGDWEHFGGSAAQLAINLAAILLAGSAVLTFQRVLYLRRLRRHESELESSAAT